MSAINPAGWTATGTATAAAATATKAAPTGGNVTHIIYGVDWGFSIAPSAPVLLQIKDGSTVIWSTYVLAGDKRVWGRGLKITSGNAVSAVLASGGAGSVGLVNIDGVTV
mgnify:CR=1 FL=1